MTRISKSTNPDMKAFGTEKRTAPVPHHDRRGLLRWLASMATALAFVAFGKPGNAAESAGASPGKSPVPAKLGDTPNVHVAGPVWLCGQPSPEDLQLAGKKGVALVLSLRLPDEISWDEEKAAKQAGLEFQRLAFTTADTMTDELLGEAREILNKAQRDGKPVILHCGVANRVGAIWLVHCVLDRGLSQADAEREAAQVGLKTASLKKRALEYVKSQQSTKAEANP